MDDISISFEEAVSAAKVFLVKLKVHIIENIKNNIYIKENRDYLLDKVQFMSSYIEIREVSVRSIAKTETTMQVRKKYLDEVYRMISLIIDLDDGLKKLEK